ncbi:MAG TPA: YciI family protein [Gemmatimonadaceae bacterium]|nr:YciI family protein [Gemmatimonadaceae bacterium]
MKYAVIVYEAPSELAAREDPQRVAGYWSAYAAYSQALGQAGVAVGGAGLQPPSMATTVRLRGGQRHVQDGPFADTKELLGGFFLIDVPDLDAALEWAARCPAAANGAVEVRPVLPAPPSA